MSSTPADCQHLPELVSTLSGLWFKEPNLKAQNDFTTINTSLRKAIAPEFQIVFAGAFSAGKSMLINALLERELLYSAEGHATGTECYIHYAESDQEKVILTFLSVQEITEQIKHLASSLGLNQETSLEQLQQSAREILGSEGGESKSERAKQAKALWLLIEGFVQNRDRLHPHQHTTYSMEQLNFGNLSEAATYARRGSNSAILKGLEYYCHHPLLQDGNILVDLPGIDAPVQKDADLTYRKIIDPDTSAVVCVLKPAAAGEMSSEETKLLEKIKGNNSIRDRIFYVFNRIDQTWYNTQLRQRLDGLIQSQFTESKRIYKTSGLLGFYGSQVKHTSHIDRFGLDTIFAESVKNLGGDEDTPQFVSEFNNYCANSGKLTRTTFQIDVKSYETPNQNYVRILTQWGQLLIEQLITDSGIEEFRAAITRYLQKEKRPQLFANLADDLQPLCINLRNHYLNQQRELESQPQEIEAMKAQELARLHQELQKIGEEFQHHISEQVNLIVVNQDQDFEQDFHRLKQNMENRLHELLQTFSVAEAYKRATLTHPRNATAPLIAILVEALYYLANELEDVLIKESQRIIKNVVDKLLKNIQNTEYCRKLYRLLGNDGGIEEKLKQLEVELDHAIVSQARTECDRYVRESPRFYDEGTFSIYQYRETLQQTAQGFDCDTMVEAEPAIRKLLRLDFDTKVKATTNRNFRQTFNQTLKTQLLPMADQQADAIIQQYPNARAYLEQNLVKEAEEKIARNRDLQSQTLASIKKYNQAVTGVNNCLKAMQVYEYQLPTIVETESTQESPANGEQE
ncbi:dynamin-like GTPase family protein [Gloeocapsa sp. PCC 73106]|uniref:dynamin-like GTPase family protein n=1 Tax=Gloeocapsa sp. PCC 73106 TaxID=102232 RepID=UPI0002ACD842|nr:dynamin-like GTPase family protein [Gloeocapsa sp. PCC 73106]ELR96450.1 dynamin family protein [Gloeocapsa sp. PCC 73106]